MNILIQITSTYQFKNNWAKDVEVHDFYNLVDEITDDQYIDAGGENITPESLCETLTSQAWHSAGTNYIEAKVV